jgi:hypothetical protein
MSPQSQGFVVKVVGEQEDFGSLLLSVGGRV